MSNFDVTYTLWLKDKLTPAINQAKRATKGLGSYADAGMDKMTSMFSKGNIAMAAAGVGVALIGKAIKEAMDFEQTQIQMEVMLGSAEKAKKLLGDIEQFAKVTPFESKDLIESTRLLLQFGVAEKKVMPLMKQLGDITAGDGEKLHSMSLAFGQMSSTGRLMGQDLNQMINAGFNPLQEISKRTGKSMAVLKQEMEKGQISIGMVEQAFADATGEGGRFNGMMDKQSKSMGGQWSTSVDTFNVTLRNLGQKMLPGLTQEISTFNKVMEGDFKGVGFEMVKFAGRTSTMLGIDHLSVAYKEHEKQQAAIRNGYMTLDATMRMVASATIPQLTQGLTYQTKLIESAANVTETQLTAALNKAREMYGLTSAQIDKFMGKVREQKALMETVSAPMTIDKMSISELEKEQERVKGEQKGSTDRQFFKTKQKEYEKYQKAIDKITGGKTGGVSTGAGVGGGGGDGTTIASRAPQNFYITIGTLVETINTRKESFNESDTETMKKVTQALTGALNDTQLIAATK